MRSYRLWRQSIERQRVGTDEDVRIFFYRPGYIGDAAYDTCTFTTWVDLMHAVQKADGFTKVIELYGGRLLVAPGTWLMEDVLLVTHEELDERPWRVQEWLREQANPQYRRERALRSARAWRRP